MEDISARFSGPSAPPSPDQLADRYAIMQLAKIYALGVDTRNIDLMKTAFKPGAKCEGSVWEGTAEEYLPKMLEGTSPFSATQHAITNQHVTFDTPDRARMWSFCIAFHAENGEQGDVTVGALYMDTVERFPQGWLIVERNAKLLYVTGKFVAKPTNPASERRLVDFVKQ